MLRTGTGIPALGKNLTIDTGVSQAANIHARQSMKPEIEAEERTMKMASDKDKLYYSLLEGFLKKEPLLALFHNGTLYVRIRPECWEKDPCIDNRTEAEKLHESGLINLQTDVWPIAWLQVLNITIYEPIEFGEIEVFPIGRTTLRFWEDEHVKIGRNNEHVGIRLWIVEQLMAEKVIQVEINDDEN